MTDICRDRSRCLLCDVWRGHTDTHVPTPGRHLCHPNPTLYPRSLGLFYDTSLPRSRYSISSDAQHGGDACAAANAESQTQHCNTVACPPPACPPAPRMCSGNCNPFDDVVHSNGIFGCELWLPFPSVARANATNRSAVDERGLFRPELCCRDPCEGVLCDIAEHERPSIMHDFDQAGDDDGLPGQAHRAGGQRVYSGLTAGLSRPTWEYLLRAIYVPYMEPKRGGYIDGFG